MTNFRNCDFMHNTISSGIDGRIVIQRIAFNGVTDIITNLNCLGENKIYLTHILQVNIYIEVLLLKK